jgi:hypothetical protein
MLDQAAKPQLLAARPEVAIHLKARLYPRSPQLAARRHSLGEGSAGSVGDAPGFIGIILEPTGEGVAVYCATEPLQRLVVVDAAEVV